MILNVLQKTVDCYFALIPRKKPSAAVMQEACLIAHRGAHQNEQGIIENTLPAFRLAQQAGCWGVELDVHVTADKVLVVNHDPTLKRLWEYDVAIAQLTFSDLRALVPNIPTLTEVVAEFGKRMHLFIELKAPFQDEMALLQVLHDLKPVTDYHLLTLNAETLHFLSHVPRQSLLLVASHNNVREFCELSLKEHYGGVLGHYLLLRNFFVRQLKYENQHFGVGIVDSKYGLYRELTRGINWIFSNQAYEISTYLQTFSDKAH